MCGITGLIAPLGQPPEALRERVRASLQALRHRGPDAQGLYEDRDLCLAHARLSVLDLSEAAGQPMQSACGRFVISYNGEVYNFKELIERYGLRDLRSTSDTEVVLQLFAQHGPGALTLFNGMFAFALYDRQARRMWLARDRFGIKPLYYCCGNYGFAFASEIKGLFALTNEPPRCAVSGLHEWLYHGTVLGGGTLYHGIRQLPPGAFLEIDVDTRRHDQHVYWSLANAVREPPQRRDRQAAIGETRRLLEQAVRRQIVSDVPVGVFLSGGIDSSSIAAFASRHYPGRLATYSVAFDFSKDGGELPKARRVAALYGTDHHEMHIAGGEVGDLVEHMVACHDLPFADAANIPLYLMAARIRANTKVVLQGDGGDELFGGYRRYTTLKYYPLLHPLARMVRPVHRRLGRESALHHRIQRYLGAFAAADLTTTMALLVTAEDRDSGLERVFAPQIVEAFRHMDPFARFRELQPQFCRQGAGNQMSLLDMSIALPDIYLEKVDRSTMAASLEVRVPFLDHDLADHALRLPESVKMPWGKKKWLLKRALAGIVPEDILYGPKRGFSVPYGAWLQTSLRPLFFDHLAAFDRRQPGILNVEFIERLYSRTAAGIQNHSSILWKTLNLLIWANNTKIDFDLQALH